MAGSAPEKQILFEMKKAAALFFLNEPYRESEMNCGATMLKIPVVYPWRNVGNR